MKKLSYGFDPRSNQLRSEAVARSFTPFVFVHCAIRLGHELFDRMVLLIIKVGNADTQSEIVRTDLRRVTGIKVFLQALRKRFGALVVCQRRQHHKFVAANTRHNVRTAETVLENLGGLGQGAVAFMVTQRIIDLFQAVEIGVNNCRDLIVEANLSEALFGNRQEAATIVKTGQLINQRQALQRRFGALAFSYVLNLKDEMHWFLVGISHQRNTAERPDDLPLTKHVALFDLTIR